MTELKSITKQLLQACKNIMSLSNEINQGGEVKDIDFFLDNLRINYTVMIELFMQIPPQQNPFVSQEDLRGQVDFVNNSINKDNLGRLIFNITSEIPVLKTKLEKALETL
ncbi:MAG: hypothetical protein II956_16895 [Bacteroidales bacterium]|nr:hypothetical protein [Bacteroidales bacterium]